MSEALLVQTAVDVDALDTAKPLTEVFQPYKTVLDKWEAKVASLSVTSLDQKTEMAQARLARLELKTARVTMDKTRVGLVSKLKERTGKIDGVARVMREKFEELESRLLESEEFAERHAAKVKAELKLAREKELTPFLDTPLLGDLSNLSADDYARTLADAKTLRQAKIDAAAKAEVDRLAKVEADRKERERMAAENARLQAEAAEAKRLADIERQRVDAERAEERRKTAEEAARVSEAARVEREAASAKAKAEREAIEKKLAEERAAAARLQAELAAKAKAESEAKAKAEAEARAIAVAAKKAAQAPDRAKLLALATTMRDVPLPVFSDETINQELMAEVTRLILWINTKARNLS